MEIGKILPEIALFLLAIFAVFIIFTYFAAFMYFDLIEGEYFDSIGESILTML